MPAFISQSPFVAGRNLVPSYMKRNVTNGMPRLVASSSGPRKSAIANMYSHNDWETSNQKHYTLSMTDRSAAHQLQAQSYQVMNNTDQRTRNRQMANTKMLGERVYDINFWKNQLQQEVAHMRDERSQLYQCRSQLRAALADSDNPLQVAQDCQRQRSGRRGIDKVYDNVEKKLSGEVERIVSSQREMRNMLDRIEQQLRLDRDAQQVCEDDSTDKHHAEGIDDNCYKLRNTSAGISYYPGIEVFDNTISVPATWLKFTKDNLKRSQLARAASEKLRCQADTLMKKCANAMKHAFVGTNTAFNTRINETKNARDRLNDQYNKCVDEINNLDANIRQLRQALQDKEAPLKVAMTRLHRRTGRLNMELCHDPAMSGLQQEVYELQATVNHLRRQLKESEKAMLKLHQTKNKLDRDISVKDNSVYIDNGNCMEMRRTFPTNGTSGLFTSLPVI